MYTTSESLLERLRSPDDQEAWDRFIDLYTPLLYYWARRISAQPNDAADLVQDVWALLIERLPKFTYDRHKSFRSWLRKVAFNRWRERRRSDGPLPVPAGDLAEQAGGDPTVDYWESDYRRHLVGRALQLMQTDFRPATWQACWQHGVLGRPATEVGAELGMSVNAVYLATSRVLTRVRQELGDLLD